MDRRLAHAALIVVAALPFSSCTCWQHTPEPPKAIERPSGFGAVGPTQRRPPERVAEAQITPVEKPTPSEKRVLPQVPVPSPAEATLPEDFPSDVPVMEGAEVVAVQQLAGNARNVLFNVEGEAPKILGFYRDTMRDKGWNVAQEYQGKDQSFLSFKRGKTITNMTVSKDPRTGKKIIAIMYYDEEELPFPEF